MSASELCTLNALGNCMVCLSSYAKCVASLYPGLFFQLTMGLMGLSSLCSFMVPCMRGAVGFMFVYFHFSACFIVILHSLMAAFIAYSF
jgi:hypothetical protein